MGETVRIRLQGQGWEFEAAAGVPLLLAAERAGIRLPSSCRNGTCRTCLCRMEGGSVRYLVDWPGVSPDERREGCILPCVAVAETDLTLIAPAARKLPTLP
jgi:ferredoxin